MGGCQSWHSNPPVYKSTNGMLTDFPVCQSFPVFSVRAWNIHCIAWYHEHEPSNQVLESCKVLSTLLLLLLPLPLLISHFLYFGFWRLWLWLECLISNVTVWLCDDVAVAHPAVQYDSVRCCASQDTSISSYMVTGDLLIANIRFCHRPLWPGASEANK